ncbi:hypothetical protein C8R46DRAFT_1042294 [Mycena filopes]|nr:hypothetical protein C8R46DRAFT_1042294 [Mycena filopes]
MPRSSQPHTNYASATMPMPPTHAPPQIVIDHVLTYNPPPTPSPRPSRPLPEVGDPVTARWGRLRNLNKEPAMKYFVAGEPGLNVSAREFRPSSRSGSGSSSHSSRSSRASSPVSSISSRTSASTHSHGAHPSSPSAVEGSYDDYLARLRTAPTLGAGVRAHLEAALTDYKLVRPIASCVPHLAIGLHARRGAEAVTALFRTTALAMFDSHWQSNDGPWRAERNTRSEYLLSRGVNLAALIGALFRAGILTGHDAHHCLHALIGTPPRGFLKLQAAHALVVESGAQLAFGETGVETERVRRALMERGADGRYLWGPHEDSQMLLEDLLVQLRRYFSSAEMAHIIANAR